jgi:multisubunit Na+/H+ antiporter MnhB subunit
VIAFAVDGLLCLLLLAGAALAVGMRGAMASVIAFVAFGLVLAIAWVRLGAVDLALAEAAIGAGLTGFLLMNAVARLRAMGVAAPVERFRLGAAATAAAVVALVALCGQALLTLGGDGEGLQRLAAEGLVRLGIENPVTAVLLDYRALDTLLEVVVLLAALGCVWAVTEEGAWGGRPGLRQRAAPEGVLAVFARALPQVGLVVGFYLVWAGSDHPGGAFQGGVVLAATALLVVLGGVIEAPSVSRTLLRLAVVAGPAAFLALGVAAAATSHFLALPETYTKTVLLVIESALAVSIGAILALAVLGPPQRGVP